jgi:hypothetical protein
MMVLELVPVVFTFGGVIGAIVALHFTGDQWVVIEDFHGVYSAYYTVYGDRKRLDEIKRYRLLQL